MRGNAVYHLPGWLPRLTWVNDVFVACFAIVALTGCGNLIILFYCWGLLEQFWPSFAESAWLFLVAFTSIVHTGLFTVLWLPVYYATRGNSSVWRASAAILLTTIYLGFWLGWMLLVFRENQ